MHRPSVIALIFCVVAGLPGQGAAQTSQAGNQAAREQARQSFVAQMNAANAAADLARIRAAQERDAAAARQAAATRPTATTPYSSGTASRIEAPRSEADAESRRRADAEIARLQAERRPERQRIAAWAAEKINRINSGAGTPEDYTGTVDLGATQLACREDLYIRQAHRASIEVAQMLVERSFSAEAGACRVNHETRRLLEQVALLNRRQGTLLGQCSVALPTPVDWSTFERIDAGEQVTSAVRNAYTQQWTYCLGRGLTDVSLASPTSKR